ncbi:hypothetical protein ABQE48_16475 [Mycolicibacterium thermoresistibile]
MQITPDTYRQRLAAFEQRAQMFRERGHVLPPHIAAQEADVLNREQEALKDMYAILQSTTQPPHTPRTVAREVQPTAASEFGDWVPNFKPITWVGLIGFPVYLVGAAFAGAFGDDNGLAQFLTTVGVGMTAIWVLWLTLKVAIHLMGVKRPGGVGGSSFGDDAEHNAVIANANMDARAVQQDAHVTTDANEYSRQVEDEADEQVRRVKSTAATVDVDEVWG